MLNNSCNKNIKYTLLILSFGYFIDFYDLTIIGVSYNELIQDLFHITNTVEIQKTYLLISNFQTIGIFIGAIVFGILGDKIGRIKTIKYSIFLYSISTLLAITTHSLPLFLMLRMLAYVGLSCEFATSTINILEIMPTKIASWGSSILYIFGILGGVSAICIGFMSWKAMFVFGGLAGLVLLLFRIKLNESLAFVYLKSNSSTSKRGDIVALLTNKLFVVKLIQYLLLILPFYLVITSMFIFPSFIVSSENIGTATKILLLGFFLGNIISSIIVAVINNLLKNYKQSIIFSIILFVIVMLSFNKISAQYLFIYSVLLGIVCGGYPISWAQQLIRDYPTHIRSTASNLLTAFGRGSGILFNILMSVSLGNENGFNSYIWYSTILISIGAITSVFLIRNTYHVNIN